MTVLFSPINLGLLGIAVFLLVVFIWVEKNAKDPIIPFELFRNKTVSISVGAGFLAGIAMFGVISFVPLFAQGALGLTATQAGSLLTPLMLSWVSMSIIGGRLLLSISYKVIPIIGFVVLTIGFSALANFARETDKIWLYIDLVLIGAGLGMTMLTLLIAVQQAVERNKQGIATSLNQFTRSIGGAFGVALMGAFLTASLAVQLNLAAQKSGGLLTVEQAQQLSENPNALIEPEAKSKLLPETLEMLQDSMAAAMHRVFWVGAFISCGATSVAFFLPLQLTGTEVDGEKLLMAEQTTIDSSHEPIAEE